MIEELEKWIDSNNSRYGDERVSCAKFTQEFSGFYTQSFLSNSYFVVLEQIPKPDFPQLRQMGFGDFIDMPVNGITYKNTYYVRTGQEKRLSLHFHELVHVVQWQILGVRGFIERYMREILTNGYNESPLELMAYSLDSYYSANKPPLDVVNHVRMNL